MKSLTIKFTLIITLVITSCMTPYNTYMYTKSQYDEAMDTMYLGKDITYIRSVSPYPISEVFSDGKDGMVYKFNLSFSYNTPSYTTTNSNTNINNNFGNLSVYGSKTSLSSQSQEITQRNFISLYTDKNGKVYDVEYFLSPMLLNMTYESYLESKGL